MSKILLSVASSLILSCPFAGAKSEFKTSCNTERPELAEQRKRLAPWFDQMNQTIQMQPEYKQVAKAMFESLSNDQCVACTLKLGKEGSIKSLNVFAPKADILEESTIALIRKSAPFKSPPGDIVSPSLIRIKFQKNNGCVEISSHLENRTIQKRIGE